ncbi:hypothetical protein DSM100238_0364 [Bifidobacterium apri]|uniref:Uncharacterized protein n=1 Tax=Bifidobacterium apri TaxID=1769423 RepID=A0A6A2W495_9BIFI|nr:hypothetical protein DSM100238_0364 [Bifidobacterium apri]
MTRRCALGRIRILIPEASLSDGPSLRVGAYRFAQRLRVGGVVGDRVGGSCRGRERHVGWCSDSPIGSLCVLVCEDWLTKWVVCGWVCQASGGVVLGL